MMSVELVLLQLLLRSQTDVMYLVGTKLFAIVAKMLKSVNVAIYIVTVINIIILIILLLPIS